MLVYLQSLKAVHPEGLNDYTSLKVPKYVSAEGRSLLNQVMWIVTRKLVKKFCIYIPNILTMIILNCTISSDTNFISFCENNLFHIQI